MNFGSEGFTRVAVLCCCWLYESLILFLSDALTCAVRQRSPLIARILRLLRYLLPQLCSQQLIRVRDDIFNCRVLLE